MCGSKALFESDEGSLAALAPGVAVAGIEIDFRNAVLIDAIAFADDDTSVLGKHPRGGSVVHPIAFAMDASATGNAFRPVVAEGSVAPQAYLQTEQADKERPNRTTDRIEIGVLQNRPWLNLL